MSHEEREIEREKETSSASAIQKASPSLVPFVHTKTTRIRKQLTIQSSCSAALRRFGMSFPVWYHSGMEFTSFTSLSMLAPSPALLLLALPELSGGGGSGGGPAPLAAEEEYSAGGATTAPFDDDDDDDDDDNGGGSGGGFVVVVEPCCEASPGAAAELPGGAGGSEEKEEEEEAGSVAVVPAGTHDGERYV